MPLSLDQTGSGKPCLVVGNYKYRESHALANGDIAWRCLGRTCTASIRTDASRSTIIQHKNTHMGKHPQTFRNTSPLLQTAKTNNTSRGSSPVKSINRHIFSPLISDVINRVEVKDRAIQTLDDSLRSKDELLDRISHLTDLQLALLDKIQSLQLELEAENTVTTHLRAEIAKATPEVAIRRKDQSTKDFAVQTSLSSSFCDQCNVTQKKLTDTEHTALLFQTDLSHLRTKYDELRTNHEELLYYHGKSRRHDDSLVDRPLEFHLDVPIKNRFDILAIDTGVTTNAIISKAPSLTKGKRNRRKKNKKNSCDVTKHDINRDISREVPADNMDKITSINNALSRNRKIYVFGDSHARGLSQFLQEKTPSTTNIFVCANSNASSGHILNNAQEMVKTFTKKDTVVLIAGTNDLSICTPRQSRPSSVLHGRIMRFVRSNPHTNWVVVTLPHRHDLPWNCYINRETKRVNRQLSEQGKSIYKSVDVQRLHRVHFTRHGLHLNSMGKRVLADLILKTVHSPRTTEYANSSPSSESPHSKSPTQTGHRSSILTRDQRRGPDASPTPPSLQSTTDFPPLSSPRRILVSTMSGSVSDSESACALSIPVHMSSRFLDASLHGEAGV